MLQNCSEKSQFMAPFTIPIGSLLDETVIPGSSAFNSEPRRVLREFLDELKKCDGDVSSATSGTLASGDTSGLERRRAKVQ